MLVLTRKTGEAITIGEHIEIIVLETNGDQIKLGIKAPKEIDIHRKEVYESIQTENREAMTMLPELDLLLRMDQKKKNEN